MLAWFRRHALILMVFLGSAAMVIFGLGSVFDSFARSVGQEKYENPVLASWKGGDLTQEDVRLLYQRHAESYRFLTSLVRASSDKAGDTVRPLAPLISPIQSDDPEQRNGEVIERVLLAQAARDQGIVVSDGMIDGYITLVSGDANFTKQDLYQINREVNSTSLAVVKEHLKLELLAMQMRRITQVGLNLMPNPTEGASLYARTAEKVECEIVPFVVDDYVSKVSAKPSDSDLRELFSEGRNEYEDPSGEKPGFKIPQKANFQYMVADESTFIRNEMNAITDEEVQAEYDRLVEKKDIMVIVPKEIDNSFLLPSDINDPPPALPGEEKKKDNDAPAPPSDVDAPPADGDTESADKKDDAKAKAKPEEDPGKADKPENAKPEAEKSGDKPAAKKDGDKQSSVTVNQTKSQRVSLQEEKEGEAKTDAKKSEEASKTDPKKEDKPSENKTEGDQEVGGIGDDLEAELSKQEEEPEFKPLKEVAEDIRRSLAIPRATVKLSDSVGEAYLEVQDHFALLQDWEDEGENGDPPTVDFEAIAKTYNMSLRETGLQTMQEMEKDPFGGIELGFGKVAGVLFYYSNIRKLYEPERLGGGGPGSALPDSYVFWTIENEEPREPTFDECKDQVKAFWLKQQALELAKKDAESLMAKVNASSGRKMSEAYPEKALPTGEFSWFDTQRPNALSLPGNVENPSEDFMETAFGLSPMKAGVAVDATRDTVYVVQSITGTRKLDEVGQDYLENQFMKFKMVPYDVQRASMYYGGKEQNKVAETLQDQLGFEAKD